MGTAPAAAAVAAVLGGAVLGSGYLALARRVRVREVDELLAPVLRRLTRA
jgi:putative peptidoglycan lipid II flippase